MKDGNYVSIRVGLQVDSSVTISDSNYNMQEVGTLPDFKNPTMEQLF